MLFALFQRTKVKRHILDIGTKKSVDKDLDMNQGQTLYKCKTPSNYSLNYNH